MRRLNMSVIICVLVLLIVCSCVQSSRLHQYYINKYEESIHVRSPELVIFPLELNEEVDDCVQRSHQLELNALLKFQWVDKLLKANLLRSYVPFSMSVNMTEPRLSIQRDGMLTLKQLVRVVTVCEFNYKYFPFDRQICLVKFEYSSLKLNRIALSHLPQTTLNFNYLASNPKWELNEITPYRKTATELTFKVNMTRKYLKYVVNIFLPSLFFVLILLVSLKMPARSPQKIVLSLIVLAIFCVCNFIFKNSMQEVKYTHSLLGLFLNLMVIDTLMAFMSVLTMNLLSRECVFFSLPMRVQVYLIANLLAERRSTRARSHLERANKKVTIKLIRSFLDPDACHLVERPGELECKRALVLAMLTKFLNKILFLTFFALFGLTFLVLLGIIPVYAWSTRFMAA